MKIQFHYVALVRRRLFRLAEHFFAVFLREFLAIDFDGNTSHGNNGKNHDRICLKRFPFSNRGTRTGVRWGWRGWAWTFSTRCNQLESSGFALIDCLTYPNKLKAEFAPNLLKDHYIKIARYSERHVCRFSSPNFQSTPTHKYSADKWF